ncbi:PREDICTED: oxidoreductase NAD-binding domain-containing protein 1 [Dipodomys ordii]|uniref:Oxidoreductase NAD-binding domain-containing protein 1 n=1 Tax=Dipodomys ordii TaxID=10020 RepID=A0A1S3FLV6_DIPOR|nr:PREDICTED: oxidoreductase NAD-binding domain-containing protein 1 [Dipodomys ordii]
MACAALLIPRLLRGSVGAICTRSALWKLTSSTLRHLAQTSVMKSKRKTDHLERTASVIRQEVVAAAKVCGAANESPSVKSLHLLVADQDFSFKAGQCGVYGNGSCSALKRKTTTRVGVMLPIPCTLDSEVEVRVGGDFFFDPQPEDAPRNLVLIAGGVGINPLLSILRHAADLHREWANKGCGYEIGTVKLFYSAKNTSELLFKKNILDLVNEFPEKIACSLHVTKQTTQISADLKPYITEGRITEKEIRDHISEETLFYICGPPPMTDFFSKQLENNHVPKEHICFEKWW